jgi:CO dehydrogenase maturation factor
VVSEPSRRSLETAADISRLARELGVLRQVLVLNRDPGHAQVAGITELPATVVRVPVLAGLVERQLTDPSVLTLPESRAMDVLIQSMLHFLRSM